MPAIGRWLETIAWRFVVLGVVASSACGDSDVNDGSSISHTGCWNHPAECEPRDEVGCGVLTSCVPNSGDHLVMACTGPPPVGDAGAPCSEESGCKPTLVCSRDRCGIGPCANFCRKAC